ncbi:MAG: hypothetical protein ACRCZF_16545 [Gemmataceae bacterium]
MRTLARLIAIGLLTLSGCGAPTLHPITGKVTLGGKPYSRLLIYFRPVSGEVTMHNLGVGETDAQGQMLGVKCASGLGLAAGEYRVTFSCMQPSTKGKPAAAGGADEKPDDNATVQMMELVRPPLDDKTSQETSPQRFTVKPGANTFEFDIPAK